MVFKESEASFGNVYLDLRNWSGHWSGSVKSSFFVNKILYDSLELRYLSKSISNHYYRQYIKSILC